MIDFQIQPIIKKLSAVKPFLMGCRLYSAHGDFMKNQLNSLRYFLLGLGLLLFLIPTSAFSMSGEVIMKKANLISYYPADDARSQILMKVYSPGKKKPIKKMFYMLKYDVEEGGEQMFFIYFTKPSDIKRTTFLVHKKLNEDDYRRLYIPSSDKVVAISGSRKQDPFMGSDFSYEDVSGRHFNQDNHELKGPEDLKGKAVYVVESVPKKREPKIAKIKSWIRKSDFVPLKVEFYNHDGELFKTYLAGKIKTIQGYPTVLKRTMISPIEGTRTILLLNPKKMKYDVGLKQSIFGERSLKNPPIKYLK